VSFILLAFNQERYIGDAVRSALDQTFAPLQLILSDDCSTDGTFEVMSNEAAAYRGPHAIRLRRNEARLGLSRHLEKVLSVCDGSFVVVAAGDDISLPERTSELVRMWLDLEKAAISIFSGYELIDKNGAVVGGKTFVAGRHPATRLERVRGNIAVEGATHAFSKEIYDAFGPMVSDPLNEDIVLQFRASLLGGVFCSPKQLVKYRRHPSSITSIESNSTSELILAAEVVHLDRYRRCLANFAVDVQTAVEKGWLTPAVGVSLSSAISTRTVQTSWRIEFLSERTNKRTILRAGLPIQTLARDIAFRNCPSFVRCLRRLKRKWRGFYDV
jgi:glycosyltransferase involved in cell wall biosynthesis